MRTIALAALLGALTAMLALWLVNPTTTFTTFRGRYSDGVFDACSDFTLGGDGRWMWTLSGSLDSHVAQGTAREENGVLLLTPTSGTGVFANAQPCRMVPVRADGWRFMLREPEVDEFAKWIHTGHSKSFGFMQSPPEGLPKPPFQRISAPPEFEARLH
ncbi:MAG: hypothetical protein K8S98_07670 [Planctomycetes bacterium]|nr:hypothetical protein [Planctomycetota bacterium]